MLIKRNHPGAEQFNVGAAVHGPLDCFQSIDLALGLPTAPGFQHRVSDSVEVLPRSSREALHGAAGPSGRDIVNHPERGGYHDNLSNVASLALVLASVAAQPMAFPLVPQGISRSDFVAEYARDILSPGLGIPGCGYDSCAKPGGWSYGEGPAAGFDAQFGWSALGNHKRN
jgi:hypothetical protein